VKEAERRQESGFPSFNSFSFFLGGGRRVNCYILGISKRQQKVTTTSVCRAKRKAIKREEGIKMKWS